MSARDVIVEVICGKYLSPSEGTYDKADDILRALGAAGYAVVPVEPTREMLNAAIDTDSFKLGDISPLGFRCSPQQMFNRAYGAMLTAAKETP